MSDSRVGNDRKFVEKYQNWTTESKEPFDLVVAEFLMFGENAVWTAAAKLEVTFSTVLRWARGKYTPVPIIQKAVVEKLCEIAMSDSPVSNDRKFVEKYQNWTTESKEPFDLVVAEFLMFGEMAVRQATNEFEVGFSTVLRWARSKGIPMRNTQNAVVTKLCEMASQYK